MIASTLRRMVAPLAVRDDLTAAHLHAWTSLGRPGVWLTGAQRVHVAAETRAARECALCRARKAALSPGWVKGDHAQASSLEPVWVDLIHRITTDAGRMSKQLLADVQPFGIDDATYVEILGICVMTLSIDTFHRALGMEPLPLPEPEPGEPSRQRPGPLDDIGAWVPVLSTRGPVARELWPGTSRVSNVRRSLSLVPPLAAEQLALVQAQYIPLSALLPTAETGRAIDRAQIELVAGRVSSINQCFY